MSNPTYVVVKTRETLVELLEKERGYNAEKYKAMDINTLELSVLQTSVSKQQQSDSLRMEVEHTSETVEEDGETRKKKACVLFLMEPIKVKVTNGTLLENMLKDVSQQAKGEPNVSVKGFSEVLVNYIPAEANEDTAPYDKMAFLAWKRHTILIQFFPLGTLVSNPLKHVLQPKFEIVRDEDEKKKIMEFWYAKSAAQFPLIRFHSDMAARCLGLIPGDFVKITTASLTAGEYVKYRLCQP